MNKVISNYSPRGEKVAFELHRTSNKKPCIIGNTKERMSKDDELFIAVFRSTGGRTAIHPLPDRDKCLCEVHIGDYISILERDNGILYINSYRISKITNTEVLANHAII